MTGLDRRTLRPLRGFDHVAQSIDVILSTQIGERVMRRQFGAGSAAVLGRLMNERLLLAWATIVAVAIDLWEPRFKVRRVLPGRNSAETLRSGRFSFAIEGEYRPRGHLGDPTAEGVRRINLVLAGDGVFVSEPA